MATLYTEESKNVHRTWLIMSVFLLIVICVGWAFSWYLDNPIILYISVLIAIATNIFSYWNSDKMVVRLTGAVPADNDQYRELHRMVENLAITAGLPKPRVYIMNDPAPNAFATGRDAEHALVAVTTGLMDVLDRTELEGVIAHELSHIGNRDMLVSTVAVTLVGFIAIVSDIFLRMFMYGAGGRDRNVHPAVLVVGIVAIVLSPVVAKLMQLAVSRKREFLADASGALLTRYPEGLANALVKIQASSRGMQRVSHATSHLFIANPFGSEKNKLSNKLNNMFSTHPPTQQRVAALMGSTTIRS